MANSLSHQHFVSLIETEYQMRTTIQHRMIIDIILEVFGNTSSVQKAKLLSMFIKVIKLDQEEQYQLQPGTIILKKKQEGGYSYQEIPTKIIVDRIIAEQLLVIERKDIIKGEILKWKCPQIEVKFLQSCSILSQIPKKRLFSFLRYVNIWKYRYGQLAYQEGDPMKNNYYLVRQGQFNFCTKSLTSDKNIELLSFKTGYIYQHSKTKNNEDTKYEQFLSKDIQSSFNYTVKCKSSQGIIYSIDQQFFNSNMLKYCEEKLTPHINNQISYLQMHAKKMIHRRSVSQVSLRHRPQSQQIMQLTAPTLSFARSNPSKHQRPKVLDLLQKPCDYFTVRQQMPKRDRLYSKAQLKKLYPNPQQDQSDALIWRKAKCTRLQQLIRPATRPPTRGQILFGFTQFTIDFHKHRKKPSLG